MGNIFSLQNLWYSFNLSKHSEEKSLMYAKVDIPLILDVNLWIWSSTKKQGKWRRPERRTFHCFEMHIFLTALLNNCSGWKSLTLCILVTECKCSITKEIRELQVQGPLFQVRKQKPQVFRRCSENKKRLTSEMQFIGSCKFLH